MVTIKDVAAAAGVSTATVSRVLNGHSSPTAATRDRVYDAVARLGYRPNGVARSLRVTRTATIGLVLGDVANPFFGELARAVEEEADAHGFSVIVGNADERPQRQERYVGSLLDRRVDGLLVVPTAGESPLLAEAVRRGTPVVLVDRTLPGLDAPTVAVDGRDAIHGLVGHLTGLGHRRIGVIAGPRTVSTGRERLAAVTEALDAGGLPVPVELVRYGDFQLASGQRGAAELLDLSSPPSVIFAADNLMALGALLEIRRRGLRIPADVGLASFDDLPWFALHQPPVTAIAQPVAELGREAVTVLRALLDGTVPTVRPLRARLVARDSCGEEPPQ